MNIKTKMQCVADLPLATQKDVLLKVFQAYVGTQAHIDQQRIDALFKEFSEQAHADAAANIKAFEDIMAWVRHPSDLHG